MSIRAGRLYIRQTKERSEGIRMSGKSQMHKGKGYGRMQWKSYHAVAWDKHSQVGNRLSVPPAPDQREERRRG